MDVALFRHRAGRDPDAMSRCLALAAVGGDSRDLIILRSDFATRARWMAPKQCYGRANVLGERYLV